MQLAILCVLMLVVYEPLLVYAKKLVVVVPRQVRRSPLIPWHQKGPSFKKTSYRNNEFYHVPPSSSGPHFYGPKLVYNRGPPFPQGGDDFDQGHEEVNHVHIPYGKEISHAISFGKGYVPYDNIKGRFSFDNDKYTETTEYGGKHHEPSPASANYSPTAIVYDAPPSSYAQEHSFGDSYFSDLKGLDFYDRKNEATKNYVPRAIGGDATKSLNGVFDDNKEDIRKGLEYFKNNNGYQDHKAEGAVFIPTGIPPATIGGSKEGIIFRDTVSLDDYNRKVQVFTEKWPSLLGASGLSQSPIIGSAADESALLNGQQQHAVDPLPSPAALIGHGYPTDPSSSSSWLSEYAQPKRGYAVKEDTMEPPHDFRSMPIQTSPFHSFPIGVKFNPSVLQSMIHAR